jgi:hypothetical protein
MVKKTMYLIFHTRGKKAVLNGNVIFDSNDPNILNSNPALIHKLERVHDSIAIKI